MNASDETLPVELSLAEVADAEGVVDVVHAAFGARAHVDPPPPALSETAETVADEIAAGAGVVARVDGRPAGFIGLQPTGEPGVVTLQRVSVHPDFQRHGVGAAMVAAVQQVAADEGFAVAELFARREFPHVVAWWERQGYTRVRELEHGFVLRRRLPVVADAATREAMHELGARLAEVLRAGDLVIASGDLGAGKTTLTQGIGRGLQVDGPIISPTFVLSRVHRSTVGGPDLVHVDAYRLGSADELDDIDLAVTADRSVTLVEWGAGLAEQLADARLEIDIRRSDVDGDEGRRVYLTGIGARWQDGSLEALAPAYATPAIPTHEGER
ncbi:tRNA (adenosine(37)-N6)-threonylcarbamoyltransferase complex ATPase subunit type 1 TsaE [Mariniluteicoccus flavus]